MAALTSAGVTVNAVYKGGGTNSRRYLYKDVTLTLSSQGGLTNNIPCALFGMSKIVGVEGPFRDASSVLYEAGPSATGAYLIFATAETAGTPADQTATVRGVVFGFDN